MPDPLRRNLPAPPKPRGRLPLLGHAVPLGRDLLGTLERWADEVGDLYRIDLPGQNLWMVNRPEEIERLMVHGEHFTRDGLEMRHARLMFGDGLLTSAGELWKKQRRMMQPAFHRERVAGYGQRMVELTEQAIAAWPPGEVRDLHAEALALSLRVVTDSLFGDDEVPTVDVGKALKAAYRRFDGLRAVLPSWLVPGAHRYREAVVRMDTVIYDLISRRRAHKLERRDLLSILLDAQDEDGTRMSDRQLRDEMMTLLLAGHDTTANTLTWAWYELARNPDVERKVFDEAAALNGPPTAADLHRLPYIGAVANEAMRLYPASWLLVRKLIDDWEIAGYRAERGANVRMCPWVVHRNPRFFPEPLRFRPERWLDGSTDSLPKYAYFPFGGGQRLCIGRPFALLEISLVLAAFARHSRFRAVADDHQMVPVPSFTLRPSGGLPMRLEKR